MQTTQLDFAGLTVMLPAPKRKGSVPYEFYPDTSGLFVAELLDWVDRAASEELPGLLKDAGKDGLESFKAATNRLRAFVRAAIPPPQGPQVARGLLPGYRTPRVIRAMQLLRDGLDEAYLLAFEVPSAEFPVDVSQKELNSIWKKLNQPQCNLIASGDDNDILIWWSTNATSAVINPTVGSVPTSGSTSTGVSSGTYTLTVTGPGGTATSSATVT